MIYIASAVLLHIFDDCTTQWSGREWIPSLKLFSPCSGFPFTFVVQKSSCWSKGQCLQLYWNLQPLHRLNWTSRKLKYRPLHPESLEQGAERGQAFTPSSQPQVCPTTPHTCPQMQSWSVPGSPAVLVHSDPGTQRTKPQREGRGLVEAARTVCFLQTRRIWGKRVDERNYVQKDAAGFGWDH